MKNDVSLGQSSLQVTPICLGTMTFGEQVDQAGAHAILDRSLERGVNFIDTAEMYAVPARAETCGATETIIGNWFAHRPGAREKVVLASKVAGPARGMPWLRGEVSKLGPVSREHVSVEEERAGYALACRVAPRGDVELEVTGKMQKPFFKGCAYASAPISTEQ